MATEKYGWKIKDPSQYEVKVVNQKITIAQINRGPADMGNYRRAVQAAEARTNPNRSLYYNLIENCVSDGILDAIIDKRIRAVNISPPSLEGTDDEKIISLFKQPWITELMRYMMESKFWGHSLVELEFNENAIKDPELEQLFKVKLTPRRNVFPEFGIVSNRADYITGGYQFREEPAVNYMLEFGKERDLGKFVNLIPYVLFKRNNWADFAQFNELFGMPLRVYEYDPNQTDTRKQVEEQAKKMGAAAYVVVPKGTNVQHVTGSTSASSGGFKEFNSIMNQEMTISVLGQTLTTGADGKGSYALGDVHKDVEEAINIEDKVWVEYQMNWVVKPHLIRVFGLNQLRGKTFKFDDTIKLTPKEKMEIFTGMLSAGVPMKLEYIYEELNMPIPDETDMELWKKLKAAMGKIMEPGINPEPDNEETSNPPSKGGKGDSKKEPPKKDLALMLSDYGMYGTPDKFGTVKLSFEDDIRAEVERIIAAIHAGSMNREDIPQSLVDLVFKQLNEAVTSGYGSLSKEIDKQTVKALRSNAFSFSAAKEFNFIRDAFGSLVDDQDQIKPFNVFRDEVLAIHDQYNVNWLRTEYNAAVGNSQMARKWNEFDDDVNIKFRAVMDARSRHKQYNGMILPKSHPAWDYMMPLLDWGCRCTVNAVRRGEITPDKDLPSRNTFKPAFQFNPGKEKMVFSKTHPYWTSLSAEQRDNSRDNWGLKEPKE